MNNQAFDQFKQTKTLQLVYTRERGYLATVVEMDGSWAWIVWDDEGRVGGGRRSFRLGAHEACQEALDWIAATKTTPANDGAKPC